MSFANRLASDLISNAASWSTACSQKTFCAETPAYCNARTASCLRILAYSSREPFIPAGHRLVSRGAPSVRNATDDWGNRDSSRDAPMVSSSGCAPNTSTRRVGSGGLACNQLEIRFQFLSPSACQFMQCGLMGKHAQGLSISVQCAYVYVNIAALHADGVSALSEIC